MFPSKSVEHYIKSGKIATYNDISEIADLNDPIILISTQHEDEISNFPIDGWHRIGKALKEGIEELPAYLLTLEETNKIRG